MLTTATDLHPRDSLAHVIGAVTPALWHRTIPEVVGSTVAEFGDREAAVFVEQNVRFSWPELAQEIDRNIEIIIINTTQSVKLFIL